MEHILDDINFDNNPIVVGVSSGPDSMCLLNLLEQKTNKLVVCHINHNVRKESTTEEEYLKDYCQKHNLIFESMKITEYKETNFENEARKKRYNFYEEILSKYHSTKLFLAHHGDDQIETILMKIVRGSNLEGYAGIKEISKVKNYQIIRPLLKVTKEDIINYNKSHNITYFIDNSNTNTDYTRNRYRQKILPLLKEEDKDVHKKFLKYSNTLLEYDNYIKSLVKKNITSIYKGSTIYISELLKLDDFLIKNTLYYILNNIYSNESNIVTEKHINSIIQLINNNKPNLNINLPNNKIIVKEYNKLLIKENTSKKSNYKIELTNNLIIDNLEFNIIDNTENDSNYICRIDKSTIALPLYFRNRIDGDYIILKGSNNKKKIKEIMIENKLPISQRITYPILIDSNNNIIWIPGIKKSKFCSKKNEKYDIIIECKEREENYE
ncbi:MAG: tRNA lysidine(34) synthetase TilS [Bacilli bacterium]|nr:tRNA lysidine(34) synthetase TilS [Bacilli bacterium]